MSKTREQPASVGPAQSWDWRIVEGKYIVAANDMTVCRMSYFPKDREAFNMQPIHALVVAAAPQLLRELSHLVNLLEPMEKDGTLCVPGLATLNGARAAIAKATGGQP